MTERIYPQWGERVFWNTLPNGLTVAVVKREGFRKKLAYFVTDYGSVHRAYTLDGESRRAPMGVAHYLEHKMFDLPRGEVSAEFAALGANPNAFTSYDMTAYYFSCTENFDACLELLLEFVSTPYFTEESVAKEQGIIGQEIGMSTDNPDHKVFELLMEAMYRTHPIREPILGTAASIAEITPQVLHDCHRAFYHPENMILCVVGDVDPEAVCRMARRILGDENPGGGKKAPVEEQDMTCPQTTVRHSMEVAMPMFQLGFKCEPAPAGDLGVRREIVGDLAAEALFGESSRLYLELYEEGLIDSSFGGGYETVDGMSMLTAGGDSRDPEAVRRAILERAQELAQTGIPEAEFLRMKRSALGRRIRDLDSFDSLCFRICAYHFTDFDYFRYPEIFRQVEQEELRQFLRQVVTPQRCALAVIDPIES